MRPQLLAPLVLAVLAATTAFAQVNYEPTPLPTTSATNRSWYSVGDPISFAGDLYYQAGPIVYFDANTMVPTGSYDGVTLYADTTLEPYSIVFVPVGGNRLRPYERLRSGDLAGTTGSRAPSFPVQVRREPRVVPREVENPQSRGRRSGAQPPPEGPMPPETAEPEGERRGGLLLETVRKPVDNRGMWISFQDFRWQQSGDAVTLDSALTRIGDYHGFPVYADVKMPYVIYIPLRGDLGAPFRRVTQ